MLSAKGVPHLAWSTRSPVNRSGPHGAARIARITVRQVLTGTAMVYNCGTD
jgi:hypothetical protein